MGWSRVHVKGLRTARLDEGLPGTFPGPLRRFRAPAHGHSRVLALMHHILCGWVLSGGKQLTTTPFVISHTRETTERRLVWLAP